MEEIKNENLERNEKQSQDLKNKKVTFTLVYILVGLFILSVLGMLIYSFIVTR